MSKVAVVVPNWNGAEHLAACIDSLLAQSKKPTVIVVDNGSTDESLELLEKYKNVEVIRHHENRGFAGGVNPGLKKAIGLGMKYVAAFNNDAVADKHWLKHLVHELESDDKLGIATCKLLDADGKKLDSTGDYYTVWGLPYPRGRGETKLDIYDEQRDIFSASGGASLYRVSMLEEVGLFDEGFFAYYEDVDLSFRAQLYGWRVVYVPGARAYHQISATSNKIKGFATYQTMKNLQLLHYKNVPRKYFYRVGWRLLLAQILFLFRAFSRGDGWTAINGDLRGSWLVVKARKARKEIQKNKKVSDDYIWRMMVHDLPPNARALRKLRLLWWKVTFRKTV